MSLIGIPSRGTPGATREGRGGRARVGRTCCLGPAPGGSSNTGPVRGLLVARGQPGGVRLVPACSISFLLRFGIFQLRVVRKEKIDDNVVCVLLSGRGGEGSSLPPLYELVLTTPPVYNSSLDEVKDRVEKDHSKSKGSKDIAHTLPTTSITSIHRLEGRNQLTCQGYPLWSGMYVVTLYKSRRSLV